MTSNIMPTGPLKFTSGNLTLFQVRVLGLFIGDFPRLELALGAEADAIMDLVIEELLEHDNEMIRETGIERLFQATWRGEVRYAALTDAGWTDVFESKEELVTHLSTKGPAI